MHNSVVKDQLPTLLGRSVENFSTQNMYHVNGITRFHLKIIDHLTINSTEMTPFINPNFNKCKHFAHFRNMSHFSQTPAVE